MTNHPNRTWRARMRADSEQWLGSSEARVLIEVPIAAQTDEQRTAAMETRIRRAYEAGYADGRSTSHRRA